MSRKLRVAIITQRYGEEVNGGAELQARWIAEHMQRQAEVEVITTCAVDFTTWADSYAPGTSELNGVTVHRFRVDQPRDWQRAQRQTARFVYSQHSIEQEEQWIREQGPYSTALLDKIRDSADEFDAFIFFTYSYATTYFALPLVADKAFLVPEAHDEPYLYFPAYRQVFQAPRGIIYNTQPERELVQRVTKNAEVPSDIAGVGVNVPGEASAARFRERYGVEGEFLLYVGRVDEAKNVHQLIEYFRHFHEETESSLKLVLLGRSHIEIPDDDKILALGFVSEQDKFDAICAATVTVMPSIYESLSIIALESWLMQTPMLVNGRCEVLKYQCRQSNGGLYYHNYPEFRATLERLVEDAPLRQILGRQGKRFAEENYDWDVVIGKFMALLQRQLGIEQGGQQGIGAA